MNREEAKKAAEVMLAYADGKDIEYDVDGSWFSLSRGENFYFDFRRHKYRVKPEPEYRPFKNSAECWNEMANHKPLGWIQDKRGIRMNILTLTDYGIEQSIGSVIIIKDYKSALDDYTFIDNAPFGVLTEKEE